MDLNALSVRCHEANRRWWFDPATGQPADRNKGKLIMLMVSELAEAMEGARKDKMDDHLPHRKMEEVEMADFVIRLGDYCGGFGYAGSLPAAWETNVLCDDPGESLMRIVRSLGRLYGNETVNGVPADRIFNAVTVLFNCAEEYCRRRGLDLWGAFEEKMAYNAQRFDHTNEGRLAEGGKKW